jgi:hypothetical protein
VSTGGTSSGGSCPDPPGACQQDGLNNHSPACALPAEDGVFFRAGMTLCPGVTDHVAVEVGPGSTLEALAWPSTPVTMGLELAPASGEGTPVVATATATDHVQLYAAPAPGRHLVKVTVPSTTGYALRVRSGLVCDLDVLCTSGRCEPLLLDLTSPTVDMAQVRRPGHCVPHQPPACGDEDGLAHNRRTDARRVNPGDTVTLATCLDDVDWVVLDVPGLASDVELTLTCSSADSLFRPYLVMLNRHGQVEWADTFLTFPLDQPVRRTIPRLLGADSGAGAGTRHLRLGQVAGLASGSCTLAVATAMHQCGDEADCQNEPVAAAFGRTLCPARACVRP